MEEIAGTVKLLRLLFRLSQFRLKARIISKEQCALGINIAVP